MNLDDLEKLQALKEKGVITEAEFTAQKEAVLAGVSGGQGVSAQGAIMPMMTAYQRYWQKSFVWSGRANRAEYWWPALVNFLINICIMIVAGILPFLGIFSLLFGIANIFPGWAVYVRRFHDRGKSAWFAFTPFLIMCALAVVAIIGAVVNYNGNGSGGFSAMQSGLFILGGVALLVSSIVWFVFLCLPGDAGENKYGTPE